MSRQKSNLFPVEKLLSVIALLQVVPRREAIKSIQWLIANIRKFDPKALAKHYGVLLYHLRNADIPAQPLCKLLVLLTSKDTVTQSRVDVLCDIFIERNNSPSISNLLQEMRKTSDAQIYFPPLGQGNARNAQIPLSICKGLQRQPDLESRSSQSVAPEGLDIKHAKMCTSLYLKLTSARKSSDVDFATMLAQLMPLVQQSGRVVLAIEKAVYEYLETEWATELNATSTLALRVIVTFFQYWPTHNMPAVRQRLLDPLLQADHSASKTLIPYLFFFGDFAAPLMASCVSLSEPRTYINWHKESVITRYIHIYQYYSLVHQTTTPPPKVLSSLIVKQMGYLPLCTQWAAYVPRIRKTLQGDFSLVDRTETNETVLHCFFPETKDDNIDVRLDIANTPWLGGYPQRTYSRLKVQGKVKNLTFLSSQKPDLTVTEINSTVLTQINLSNEDFGVQLIADLREVGIDVFPYLETVVSEIVSDGVSESVSESVSDGNYDNYNENNIENGDENEVQLETRKIDEQPMSHKRGPSPSMPSMPNMPSSLSRPSRPSSPSSADVICGPRGSTHTPSTPTPGTPTTASTETAAEPEPKRRALNI